MAEPLTTRIEAAATPTIHLIGDIDRTAAGTMAAVAAEIVRLSPTTVILDFAETAYIDSSGIALLVGLLGRTRATGVAVEAHELNDHYRHVFEITRLTTYMTIRDDNKGADVG